MKNPCSKCPLKTHALSGPHGPHVKVPSEPFTHGFTPRESLNLAGTGTGMRMAVTEKQESMSAAL